MIISLEGKKVTKLPEVGEILKGRKAGSTVKLTYRRKNEEVTVDVRLTSRAEMFTE